MDVNMVDKMNVVKPKLKPRLKPKVYWTYQRCLEQASKYDSLSEWFKKHTSSYKFAVKKNWQKKIAADLSWLSAKPKKYWSYQRCLKKAAKCNSLSEWQKHHASSYVFALKKNWQRKIAAEISWVSVIGYWTYQHCLEQASKYNSLSEWYRTHASSYTIAVRNKWQRKIAAELSWVILKPKVYWTYQRCLEQASKYNSLSEWRKKHRSCYTIAVRNKWQRVIAADLSWKVNGI